jgi:AcrR family transcriptional regulator
MAHTDGNADQKETKSARTRKRILDAAARAFRDKGYAGTRLADVAELAGMRTGSLYYHFKTREELVDEVLRLGLQIAAEQHQRAMAALGPDASALDRLRTAMRVHMKNALEVTDYIAAANRIDDELPHEIRRRHLIDLIRYGEFWNDLLADAVERGEIRSDLDLFTTRMLMLGALNTAVEWYNPRRGPSLETVVAEATTLFVDGLTIGVSE